MGGRWDLTFVPTELVRRAQCEVDVELTSDHFATITTLSGAPSSAVPATQTEYQESQLGRVSR